MRQISRHLFRKIALRYYANKVSFPYLSGDAFSSLADYSISTRQHIAELQKFDLTDKTVFCVSHLVQTFVESRKHYGKGHILLAGNSDFEFTEAALEISKFFEFAFLQNSLISDNKTIFTLPIGIENLRHARNGLIKRVKPGPPLGSRSKNILVGPFSSTHIERRKFENRKLFSSPEFSLVEGALTPRQYQKIASEHKFVVCPRGNGVDTHRTWETLYRGAIPILKRDRWSQSLLHYGLPIILVEDYDPKEILEAAHEAISNHIFTSYNPLNAESLWIDYWKRRLLK